MVLEGRAFQLSKAWVSNSGDWRSRCRSVAAQEIRNFIMPASDGELKCRLAVGSLRVEIRSLRNQRFHHICVTLLYGNMKCSRFNFPNLLSDSSVCHLFLDSPFQVLEDRVRPCVRCSAPDSFRYPLLAASTLMTRCSVSQFALRGWKRCRFLSRMHIAFCKFSQTWETLSRSVVSRKGAEAQSLDASLRGLCAFA